MMNIQAISKFNLLAVEKKATFDGDLPRNTGETYRLN
jgi:hypothetical protein